MARPHPKSGRHLFHPKAAKPMRYGCLILAAVVFCSGFARADDRSEILSLFHVHSVEQLEVVGDWCAPILMVLDENDEVCGCGTVILRKIKGRWHIVHRSPGVVSPSLLHTLGVPYKHWRALGGVQGPAPGWTQSKLSEIRRQGPAWPENRTTKLDPDRLQRLSSWELSLMAAEIWARRGYQFQSPELQAYFASRAWYQASSGFSAAELSDTEVQNLRLLGDHLEKRGQLLLGPRLPR